MSFTQAFYDLRTGAAHSRGFTLIELMIVIAILGALAAFAIPNYRNYNMRANRSVAAQMLLAIQNREEQYMLDARDYTDILGSTGLNMSQEGWTCTTSAATGCSNLFYTVTVAKNPGTCTAPCYTLTATPITGKYQTADGYLTLTNTGIRYRSVSDNKW